jgi:hypothetical protein
MVASDAIAFARAQDRIAAVATSPVIQAKAAVA